ncbi:MAG: RDD family protein [Candidatus Bathyarchaeia archaeon]
MTSNSSSSGQLDFSLWLIRLIAYIIDGVIIFVATVILGIIAAVIAAVSVIASGGLFFYGGIWLTFGLFGLLSILYFIVLDVIWGATIGKRVMGLQVQTVKGARIAYGQSFIRNISKINPLLVFLDWLIAILTAGPDKRQKLTDRWAGTTVVQAGKAPISLNEPLYSTPPPPPPPPS